MFVGFKACKPILGYLMSKLIFFACNYIIILICKQL